MLRQLSHRFQGFLFYPVLPYNEMEAPQLPNSESAQGFSENPDITLFTILILVGVPVVLCFNRQSFLKVEKKMLLGFPNF